MDIKMYVTFNQIHHYKQRMGNGNSNERTRWLVIIINKQSVIKNLSTRVQKLPICPSSFLGRLPNTNTEVVPPTEETTKYAITCFSMLCNI